MSHLPFSPRATTVPSSFDRPPLLVRCPPDGNCMFHALAVPTTTHDVVRRVVASFVEQEWDAYAPFLPDGEGEAYLRALRRPGAWGDEVVLRAFADMSGVPVRVLCHRTGGVVAEYAPRSPVAHSVTRVLLYDGAHYDALLPSSS